MAWQNFLSCAGLFIGSDSEIIENNEGARKETIFAPLSHVNITHLHRATPFIKTLETRGLVALAADVLSLREEYLGMKFDLAD